MVIVADPETGDIDGFGPYDEMSARAEAIRRRHELDAERLEDVLVVVVTLTPPR